MGNKTRASMMRAAGECCSFAFLTEHYIQWFSFASFINLGKSYLMGNCYLLNDAYYIFDCRSLESLTLLIKLRVVWLLSLKQRVLKHHVQSTRRFLHRVHMHNLQR